MNEKITFAFPHSTSENNESGITVRDYFAAKALQGALAGDDAPIHSDPWFDLFAKIAYKYADAMIKARVEEKNPIK